ncbi:lantibiotic ABC transporter permease [Carnobacterium inhibens]|uniref:lantibiotic ABC transporter permease n=1 Tax=Carnobacterium inhibens TaxID=147709 RepID=UPI00204237AA|nr:lantibiotic ABC transporter permease [Carnobacterium inhibens]MCM3512084.1 lantibiotic ABC transporter permease [Carnobacterium inhibens]
MIIIVLRFFLFCLSTYGYRIYIERKFGYPSKLSLIVVFCANIIVLYIASLLGFLYGTAIAMFLIGLLLFSVNLFRDKNDSKIRLFSLDLTRIWMIGYFLIFSVILLQSSLVHYDNFSHWAVIVKYLITEASLPTATTGIISFTSYPIGSSLFVYYVTLIVGYHEGVMLLGQFMLIMAALYSLFSVIRDSSRTLMTSSLFLTIALFNYFNIAIRMNNLLVDFILPLLALAAVSGIYVLRKNFLLSSIHTILLLSVLAIVKNSGLFFVVIVLIYYLYTSIKNFNKEQSKIILLVVGTGSTVMFSISTFILWEVHVKNTFTEEVSKHSVNISSYQDIFAEKTNEITNQIIHIFTSTVIDWHSLSTQGIIFVNVIFIGAYLIIRVGFKRKNSLIKMLFLTDAIVILYYIGILGMFLFSMPIEEALVLAGFERYASSMVIFSLGILSITLVQEMDSLLYEQTIAMRNHRSYKSIKTKKYYQYSSILLLFFSTGLILSESNGMMFSNKNYENEIPYLIKNITGDNQDLNNASYLIVSADKESIDSYYTQYVGKYYLYSNQVDAIENFIISDEEFISTLSNYDYIVVIDEHYTFNALAKKILNINIKQQVYSSEELLANYNNR